MEQQVPAVDDCILGVTDLIDIEPLMQGKSLSESPIRLPLMRVGDARNEG